VRGTRLRQIKSDWYYLWIDAMYLKISGGRPHHRHSSSFDT
jgi:hypothetical protein